MLLILSVYSNICTVFVNITLIVHLLAGCVTGSVRLDDGILQICNSSVWKTVCSEDWGNLDAAVACKQLGFDGIIAKYCCYRKCS